jgi:phosphatidylserine/phosphatidylglycerophosphate/cardiolipin synthase-like enzyme
MMIFDVPESIGAGPHLGRFIQADSPDDDGAKLLNVAISRARKHVVIIGNLTYLDPKLPSQAMLRRYLHAMQVNGRVVDAREVLAFRPITEDLRRHTTRNNSPLAADEFGMFRQDGFDQAFIRDIETATKSVAVFSGFITPQRVAAYGDLFRRKIAEGVVIRCVTRPPQNNGTMDRLETTRALDALEGIGVIVDTRWVIHQKVVIVDGETVWFGSLNPLSHTARTDELMMRVISREWAASLASLLSVGRAGDREGLGIRQENPRCHCGGRTHYSKGRYGPYFKCETCGDTENIR